MRKLFETHSGWAGFFLRLGLGIAIFPHGMQKLLGLFGGPGFDKALHGLVTHHHIPVWLAVLVILSESLGSVGLILGCLTRVAALGIFCDMVGAIYLVHWRFGFFMNWHGNKAGEGIEYHILVLAMSLALIIAGGGAASVDGAIAKKKR